MHSRQLGFAASHRVRRALAVGVVSLVALAGCSGSAEPAPPSAATDPTSPATSTSVVEPRSIPATAPPAADLYAAACAGTLDVTSAGRVAAEAGSEISGIVASRANPGVLWVHDDSGAGPAVYAIAGDGTMLATFDLGTDAIDWEDIAIAPAADGTGWSLVVGDIGDNDEARDAVELQRIDEPAVDPSGTGAAGPDDVQAVTGLTTVTLTYPDHAHNAEALLVDPDTGQVVIITKEIVGPAQVFVAPGESIVDGAVVVLTPAGSVDFGDEGLGSWVTGADIAPDGTVIAVRTYGGVHLFARTAGQAVPDALATTACTGPTPLEVQGEAVAISADGRSYLTVSEGAEPILHLTS